MDHRKNRAATLEAADAFREAYGPHAGVGNFMTPSLVERGMAGPDIAWEISEGRGMSNQPIFGVTVVSRPAPGASFARDDRSGLEQSFEAAQDRVRSLYPPPPVGPLGRALFQINPKGV